MYMDININKRLQNGEKTNVEELSCCTQKAKHSVTNIRSRFNKKTFLSVANTQEVASL